jgi:hypothetical protein
MMFPLTEGMRMLEQGGEHGRPCGDRLCLSRYAVGSTPPDAKRSSAVKSIRRVMAVSIRLSAVKSLGKLHRGPPRPVSAVHNTG